MKINELNYKQKNIYNNLKNQVDSFFNKTNEKSFKTRDRYSDGMHDFSKFLAKYYKKENIKSIKNKHIQSYVDHMQKENGKYSTSYITTNLSAIRFFYERISNGKMHIKTNHQLGVIPRNQVERIGKNRSMNNDDYLDLLKKADDSGLNKYSQILLLGKTFGLRLHESFSLRKSQLNKAIKTNKLEVKGKGGLIRTLPVTSEEKILIKNVINSSKTGSDRIFIEKNEKTHKEMKSFQNFIRNSRREGISSTYHSLRHSYAQNLYNSLIKTGLSDAESVKIVNKRLGHGPNRTDITRIYLQK